MQENPARPSGDIDSILSHRDAQNSMGESRITLQEFKWHDFRILSWRPADYPELTRVSKDFIQGEFEKFGYLGYSTDYDSNFDANSFYFAAYKGGKEEPSAVLRLTEKQEVPIPIESASRPDGSRYELPAEGIFELNSFVYKDTRVLPFLFRTIGEYTTKTKKTSGFLLVDTRSARYRALYERSGFVPAADYPESVHFADFQWPDGKPVQWLIMEITRERVREVWGDRRRVERTELDPPEAVMLSHAEREAEQVGALLESLSERGARLSAPGRFCRDYTLLIRRESGSTARARVLRARYQPSIGRSVVHARFETPAE